MPVKASMDKCNAYETGVSLDSRHSLTVLTLFVNELLTEPAMATDIQKKHAGNYFLKINRLKFIKEVNTLMHISYKTA